MQKGCSMHEKHRANQHLQEKEKEKRNRKKKKENCKLITKEKRTKK